MKRTSERAIKSLHRRPVILRRFYSMAYRRIELSNQSHHDDGPHPRSLTQLAQPAIRPESFFLILFSLSLRLIVFHLFLANYADTSRKFLHSFLSFCQKFHLKFE